MLLKLLVILTIGVWLLSGCHDESRWDNEKHDVILLGTGPESGSYDYFGSQLLNHLRYNSRITGDLPLLHLDTLSTTGAGSNLKLLQERKIALGIVQEDLIPHDFSEMHLLEEYQKPEVRIIAPLYAEPITLILASDLAYAGNSLSSLDGRIFGVGPPGSGTRHNALNVLRLMKMHKSLDKKRPFANLREAVALFEKHEIDGFFLTMGHPNTALRDSFKKIGRSARFVDLPPEAFPLGRYIPWIIPHEFYPELTPDQGVSTMATHAMLCSLADSSIISDDFIYSVVRNLYLNIVRITLG